MNDPTQPSLTFVPPEEKQTAEVASVSDTGTREAVSYETQEANVARLRRAVAHRETALRRAFWYDVAAALCALFILPPFFVRAYPLVGLMVFCTVLLGMGNLAHTWLGSRELKTAAASLREASEADALVPLVETLALFQRVTHNMVRLGTGSNDRAARVSARHALANLLPGLMSEEMSALTSAHCEILYRELEVVTASSRTMTEEDAVFALVVVHSTEALAGERALRALEAIVRLRGECPAKRKLREAAREHLPALRELLASRRAPEELLRPR